MQGLFPLCRAQFDSTFKICLDHKPNCTSACPGSSAWSDLTNWQGMPGLEGVWVIYLGRRSLSWLCFTQGCESGLRGVGAV